LKGRILASHDHGIILGEDENRYTFSRREDWKSEGIEPQAAGQSH